MKSIDIRIETTMPRNLKIVRLVKRLGNAGLGCAVRLWCNVAEQFYRDGVMSGSTVEEIEETFAGWDGDPGAFVSACLDLGLMEYDGTEYSIHDWLENQPYAATRDDRLASAKKAGAASASKRATTKRPVERPVGRPVERPVEQQTNDTFNPCPVPSCPVPSCPDPSRPVQTEQGVQGENAAPAPPPAHTVSEKKPKAEDKNAARVYDHYLHNVQTTHASNREQTIRNISSLITRLQKEDIGDGKTREDLATYLCQTIDRYLRSAAYQTDPQFHYKASNFFGRRGEWCAFAQDDSPAMMPLEDEDARRRREIREEIAKRRDACFADYEARGIDCRTITLVDVPKGANCDGCRRQIMALDEQAKRAETREQTVLETEAAV